MRPQLTTLLDIYKRSRGLISDIKQDFDLAKINNILAKIYSPGPSFQFIFEFANQDFSYISPGIEDILNFDRKAFGINEYTNLIHPSDMELVIKFEQLATFFLFSFIDRAEIPYYKVSYQFRVRDKFGRYRLILHQAVAISYDDDFKLIATLVNHSDISHITTTNNNRASFIHINEGVSYFNIRDKEDLKHHNSRKDGYRSREIEILGLISEGLTSKEIATYLNISLATVQTHRKNILSRNKFGNISHAVAHYIKEGVI